MDRPSAPLVDLQIAGVGPAVEVRTSGTARVYRAPHLTFGHDVTVKVVPDSRGRAARLRFEREQLAMTRLSTVDGVLPLLEAGSTVDGDLYLMAPYVDGPTLQDRLASGPLGWDEAAAIMEEVAYTIHHAHVVGVVHRDLKPSTIVVEEGTGRAVVTELGFVGLTMDATAQVEGRHEDLVFTPGYSPPEAFRPGKPTLQLDVYSMGATLWALIAGRPPFTAPGDDAIADVIERTETCRAGDLRDLAPAAIADVIDRAMAHDPADRQDSAATLARELREAQLDDPFFVAGTTSVVAGWRPLPRSFPAVPVTEPEAATEPMAVPLAPPEPVVATSAEPPVREPRAATTAAHAPVDDESTDDRRRAGILVGAGVAAIAAVALAASTALILFVDDTDEPVRISGPLVESVDPAAPAADSSGTESPAATPEVLGLEVEPETAEEPNRMLSLTPFAIPTPTAVPTIAPVPPPPTATPDEVISAPPPPTATPDEAISAPPPPTATPEPTAQPTVAPTPPPTVVPTVTPVPTTPATPPSQPTPPA